MFHLTPPATRVWRKTSDAISRENGIKRIITFAHNNVNKTRQKKLQKKSIDYLHQQNYNVIVKMG